MKINKKGISLIVLVITIIVMVILATAIILSLDSNNIIRKAKDARAASDLANAKNVVTLAKAEWDLMTSVERESNGGIFSAYASSKLQEEGYAVSGNGGVKATEYGAINTIYVGDDNRQAIIPEGFAVSTKASEDSVTEGLVISDVKGNEFVWVPVDDFSKFERTTTYYGKITKPSSSYTEPFNKTTSDGITLSLSNDLTGEWAEYTAMRASVQENKGFYIGRYETGTTTERTNIANGTTDVLVQKGKPVYNYVAWGPSMTSASGNVTYNGKNQGKGAVELSRDMYKSSQSVVSTLCYSVQWDSALQFIYNTSKSYPISHSYDSGSYIRLVNTGSSDNYAINNIYDMAGNVCEWTMEALDTIGRGLRGDSFFSVDFVTTTPSDRSFSHPDSTYDNYGFRLTLYIK